jgi:hypothetical protein
LKNLLFYCIIRKKYIDKDTSKIDSSILRQTKQVEQASKVLSHSSDNLNDIVSAFNIKQVINIKCAQIKEE